MTDMKSELTQTFNVGSSNKIVVEGDKKYIGTLGLLVRRVGGNRSVYGLSFYDMTHSSSVYLYESNSLIGSFIPTITQEGESNEKISIDNLVSYFEIHPGTKISTLEDKKITDFKLITPKEAFGKKVYKSDNKGNISYGFVTSVYSTLLAKNPLTNEMNVFKDIIEVESLGQDGFGKAGDAGALVSTMNGGIVGLFISANDEVSFIAPLDRIFERENFVILNRDLADQFNSNVRPEKDLISYCKELPDFVVEKFNAVRDDLNCFFSALEENSVRELENFQDLLAKEIYVRIGSKIYEQYWAELFSDNPWFDRAMRSIASTKNLPEKDCRLIFSLLENSRRNDILDHDSENIPRPPFVLSCE